MTPLPNEGGVNVGAGHARDHIVFAGMARSYTNHDSVFKIEAA